MKKTFKLTLAALALASSTALMAVDDEPTSIDERTERFLSLQASLQEKLARLYSCRGETACLIGAATFSESDEIEAKLEDYDAEIAETRKALKDLDDMMALPAPEYPPCVARFTQEENEGDYIARATTNYDCGCIDYMIEDDFIKESRPHRGPQGEPA